MLVDKDWATPRLVYSFLILHLWWHKCPEVFLPWEWKLLVTCWQYRQVRGIEKPIPSFSFKVAEFSFLVHNYALFIAIFKPLQLGGQNWHRPSSTKKRSYFDMFYGAKYHCHGNMAGNKLALTNGFDLFSENPVIRFFLSQENSEKYWPIDNGLLTGRSSVIWCFAF